MQASSERWRAIVIVRSSSSGYMISRPAPSSVLPSSRVRVIAKRAEIGDVGAGQADLHASLCYSVAPAVFGPMPGSQKWWSRSRCCLPPLARRQAVKRAVAITFATTA